MKIPIRILCLTRPPPRSPVASRLVQITKARAEGRRNKIVRGVGIGRENQKQRSRGCLRGGGGGGVLAHAGGTNASKLEENGCGDGWGAMGAVVVILGGGGVGR